MTTITPIGSNQTRVSTKNAIFFLSYETPIVCVTENNVFVNEKKYSKTTTKHKKGFLNSIVENHINGFVAFNSLYLSEDDMKRTFDKAVKE